MYKTQQHPQSALALSNCFEIHPLEFVAFSQRSCDHWSCPSRRCFDTTQAATSLSSAACREAGQVDDDWTFFYSTLKCESATDDPLGWSSAY